MFTVKLCIWRSSYYRVGVFILVFRFRRWLAEYLSQSLQNNHFINILSSGLQMHNRVEGKSTIYWIQRFWVLNLSLFCCALLCVLSNFAIILKRKRKLVALLVLSNGCLVAVFVLWLPLTVQLVGLWCVIVVFPDHTYLLFEYFIFNVEKEVISSGCITL